MLQAIRQKADWFTPERRIWCVGVFMAGLVGFGIGNGHTTSTAIQHISKQLGDAKKDKVKALQFAGCEHWRADVTEQVAAQAIGSRLTPAVPPPDSAAIPKDCPHIN